MRRKDGSFEEASSGTLVFKDGSYKHLDLSSFMVDVKDYWVRPETGARYPSSWAINVPYEGINVEINPLLEDQEINSANSTGVVYWEGAVEGFATGGGRGNTEVSGYVEMTGYADSLGGIF